MNRQCKSCNEIFDINSFYKVGDGYYNHRCKTCVCKSKRKNKDREYVPHPIVKKTKKFVNREDVFIDNDMIYILLKRIEINNFKIDYIDALKLIDTYLNVFGNDVSDKYDELKQFDIMFHRLNQYIIKINEKKIKK